MENSETLEHGHGRDHVPHVVPLKYYLGVAGALLVLTGVTVGASYVDFGEWNTAIALLIASTKALLVAAVFMHLAFDKGFNIVVLLVAVIFLVILIAFTAADTTTRGMGEEIEAARARKVDAPFLEGKPDIYGQPARAPAPVGGTAPSGAQPPAPAAKEPAPAH